jgi:DNA-binding transcriptional ArsR family regulator
MTSASQDEAVFFAIADPCRRRLLDLLVEGEAPAQALARQFDVSFPAVSQHLKVLREAGLVSRRAEGRERIYSLTPEKLRVVEEWTARYRKFWGNRLKRLGAYLDEAK